MLLSTRRKLKKIFVSLCWLGVIAFAVWANYNRFYNNNFANYEKAVDYGRVREKKEIIRPVITAVFYQGTQSDAKTLSSYLNHWDADRVKNPRILAVPEKITPESLRVIAKLYKEINKNSQFEKIMLVYDNYLDDEQRQLIKQNFRGADLEEISIEKQEASAAAEEALKQDKTLVIFALDLADDKRNNFLTDKLIYLAQKNFYKVRIFDEVDTQLARALEENYASWFENESAEERNVLRKQKANLIEYRKHYGDDILRYFTQNMEIPANAEAVWPDKTPQTYRLFDRGAVYIRFFGIGGKEVFSRAKIGKNKGIIVAVIGLARKAVIKIHQPIESYKIYLLTELEKIDKDINIPLVNYLESDDGVYIQYRGRSALMAADERPEDEDALTAALRTRAKIPENATDDEIEYYRFKTVEINDEN